VVTVAQAASASLVGTGSNLAIRVGQDLQSASVSPRLQTTSTECESGSRRWISHSASPHSVNSLEVDSCQLRRPHRLRRQLGCERGRQLRQHGGVGDLYSSRLAWSSSIIVHGRILLGDEAPTALMLIWLSSVKW